MSEKQQRIPFKLGTHFTQGYHHRYDLRSWIRSEFGFIEHVVKYSPEEMQILVERAPEILNACEQIRKIDERAGSDYVDYYKPCWKWLNEGVKRGDYEHFARGLHFLLCSIDTE